MQKLGTGTLSRCSGFYLSAYLRNPESFRHKASDENPGLRLFPNVLTYTEKLRVSFFLVLGERKKKGKSDFSKCRKPHSLTTRDFFSHLSPHLPIDLYLLTLRKKVSCTRES